MYANLNHEEKDHETRARHYPLNANHDRGGGGGVPYRVLEATVAYATLICTFYYYYYYY